MNVVSRTPAILIALTVALQACSSPSATSSDVVQITSADVKPASVVSSVVGAPGFDISRIVVAAEGVVELVAAMGFGANVVGRGMTGAQVVPDATLIAPAHSLNAEAALALRPTLLITDERVAPSSAVETIAQANVAVLKLPVADSMATARDRVAVLAQALGVSLDAASLFPEPGWVEQSAPRVAFLYLRGTSAIFLVGGKGSGADEVLASAGAVDVGASLGLGPFTPLTPESLAGQSVDVLLVMTKGLESVGGVGGLLSLPGVAQTAAAKNMRVITVDDDLLLSFGLYTPDLIEKLRQALL